jgi:opacity protein-like surface antigen
MKALAIAALLGATLMASAQAEEVTISHALAAGSLHEGALDMVAYWLDGPDGALELTATFRDRTTDDEPMRVVMPLQDGDALSFGMPGYPSLLYTFARAQSDVTISVVSKPEMMATVATSVDEAKILSQPVSAD